MMHRERKVLEIQGLFLFRQHLRDMVGALTPHQGNSMKTIYFAGPDVFNPDYPQVKANIRTLCAAGSLKPLLPGDLELDTAEAIFRHNLSLIDQADGVIANLNPFRGVIEPDSGTVFECAYAYARGKWVVGCLADHRDLATKLRQTPIGPPNDALLCRDGPLVEDFGLPLNLMLARSLTALAGGLEEAIQKAASQAA
jgi:nucleoside 2-deoxyribosyltransferase